MGSDADCPGDVNPDREYYAEYPECAVDPAVLKAGKVVEQGTPAELEQQRGEYYALLTLQREQYHRDERPEDEEERRHAAPDF